MERLPGHLCLKIFCFLDHQSLAAAQQVCKKWKVLASENTLWSRLFKERWGEDYSTFNAPIGSASWKHEYETQDRCDRVGSEMKIIREGGDYFVVHGGVIQRYLGSWRKRKEGAASDLTSSSSNAAEESQRGIAEKILFFIGDLEVATAAAKRGRLQ